MSSLNKVMLIGRLGKDPEVRYTSSGTPVATFSVATSEQWKDGNGQKQEKTEWMNIVVWSKLAEVVKKYLTKGAQVYLEGKLTTRKWQDREGGQRYTTEVVANKMVLLGGKRAESEHEQPEPQSYSGTGHAETSVTDDGIPF